MLFKSPGGESSQAQIEAFDDTWHWNETAERAFDDVMDSGNTDAAEMLRAMRLIELHRVLKPTGSLYLHCDPTASHYLKILLDAIFGNKNYINQIIWLRANAHNFKTRFWPRQHDTLLLYGKTNKVVINPQYEPYGPVQLSRYKTDENGRLFTGQDMTVSLVRRLRQFEWRGVTPPPHRSWGASMERLALLWHFSFAGIGEKLLTMRTSLWGRPREEAENGLSDGRHARLWRWIPDSFFSVLRL